MKKKNTQLIKEYLYNLREYNWLRWDDTSNPTKYAFGSSIIYSSLIFIILYKVSSSRLLASFLYFLFKRIKLKTLLLKRNWAYSSILNQPQPQ